MDGGVAVLAGILQAELQLDGRQLDLVLQGRLPLIVLNAAADLGSLDDLVADVDLFFQFVLGVVDGRVAQFEGGLPAQHVATIAAVHRPVVGQDVERVAAHLGDVVDIAFIIFDRVLVLDPVSADEQAVQLQLAAGQRHVIRQVGRVVSAVADVALGFGVGQFAVRLLEPLAELLLGIAAILDIAADQQTTGADLAAPDGAIGPAPLAVLAVVPVQGAQAHIAAVQRQSVAQHDVDGAGHRVARTVGRRRTHHLDPFDQFGGDTVDEEGPVQIGAGHALAVDQDLGVGGIQAAHSHAVGFQNIGQEGHRRHALQGVAGGQRFKALEVVEIVGQGRHNGVGAVAHRRLARDDDLGQGRDRAVVIVRRPDDFFGADSAGDGERGDGGAQQKTQLHLSCSPMKPACDQVAVCRGRSLTGCGDADATISRRGFASLRTVRRQIVWKLSVLEKTA
ncbi:hypothetical protein D3C71_845080 [compost metagenome]